MKEKMTGMQWVEKKDWVRYKVLPIAALLYALWLPQEWSANGLSGIDEETTVMEITPQVQDKKDDIIDLWVTARWTSVKDSDEWVISWDEWVISWDEWVISWDEDEKEPLITGWDGDDGEKVWDEGWGIKWEKEKSRISTSGFIQVWTSIVPDFASICSDKPSMMLFVDATDSKSWLWLSYIRLDDFHKDPDYPVSRASVLVPHRSKTLWDGKRTVWASVECTYVDNSPEMSELLPLVVWSYDTKTWWTFEWKYFHEIMKWPDTDAFRLWITKKIWDALSLTAQWWYKSDYDDKFFGRIVADIDIWNGLWAQVSWVIKDGKISPTAWVLYKF